MSYALRMAGVNQAIKDLQIYITNHPEDFG